MHHEVQPRFLLEGGAFIFLIVEIEWILQGDLSDFLCEKKIKNIIDRITLHDQRLNPAAPFGRVGSADDIVLAEKWGSRYRIPKIL